MKLTARIKLLPDPAQVDGFYVTLQRCNEACDWISAQAWEAQVFGQFSLHKLVYHDVRKRFGLSAQMAVRAISKVADAYKANRKILRTFLPLGAFPYDSRILSWNLGASTVSILTLDGRQRMPFVCRERDRQLLAGKRSEADLCRIDGDWYLFVACEVEAPDPIDVEDYLGVDFGIVNIASDSDGEIHGGGQINGHRRRHRRLRKRLQSKGTKSAKRLLKKRRRKESYFARHVNHCVSKRIVATAERTGRGIALEDLKGIRDRIRARRSQRATLHSWAFLQLRQFVTYKAQLAGVPVVTVNPAYTSRTCPGCGLIDKRNRPSQAVFSCIGCGLAGPADVIAAENIRRAAVNRSYADAA